MVEQQDPVPKLEDAAQLTASLVAIRHRAEVKGGHKWSTILGSLSKPARNHEEQSKARQETDR
jgi:hypothetical protein